MPECYEFEECEYNGQPRCYLPDGVDCPHGVGAGANEGGHLMDIDKLIEDLRGLLEQYGEKIPYGELVGAPWPYSKAGDLVWPDPEPYFIEQAATALSTLQAENEKLRAELEKVKRALAMMWFAYVNSDKESPHSYETEALEEAECLLGPWEECMPKYLRRGQKED